MQAVERLVRKYRNPVIDDEDLGDGAYVTQDDDIEANAYVSAGEGSGQSAEEAGASGGEDACLPAEEDPYEPARGGAYAFISEDQEMPPAAEDVEVEAKEEDTARRLVERRAVRPGGAKGSGKAGKGFAAKAFSVFGEQRSRGAAERATATEWRGGGGPNRLRESPHPPPWRGIGSAAPPGRRRRRRRCREHGRGEQAADPAEEGEEKAEEAEADEALAEDEQEVEVEEEPVHSFFAPWRTGKGAAATDRPRLAGGRAPAASRPQGVGTAGAGGREAEAARGGQGGMHKRGSNGSIAGGTFNAFLANAAREEELRAAPSTPPRRPRPSTSGAGACAGGRAEAAPAAEDPAGRERRGPSGEGAGVRAQSVGDKIQTLIQQGIELDADALAALFGTRASIADAVLEELERRSYAHDDEHAASGFVVWAVAQKEQHGPDGLLRPSTANPALSRVDKFFKETRNVGGAGKRRRRT